MQRICRSLAGAGYDVELVGRELFNSSPLANEPFKQTRLKCWFNKGKLFYAEYNLRLFLHLLLQKADALCAIDLDTITAVYCAGKIKGSKLVYDAHEYFTEVPEVIRRPTVQKVWRCVERTFVPKFNLAYTVSPAIAELFSQQLKKPFHVIMNVPLRRNINPVPAQPRYLLYQGALNEGRGLEQLIEAMPGIEANLWLAGDGDLSNELRNLVKKLQLENKVRFLGRVEPQRLQQITEDCLIGINLLENKGLSYYYSLSNKFFDYIHAGIPQVCIDFPEYRKLNDEYKVALLVKDCSGAEITGAVNRLLNDHLSYARLQKKCEVCRQTLNWQNEERKLLALYDELFR
jgi:glycosyltransferase involved in cell wall biosynthesis